MLREPDRKILVFAGDQRSCKKQPQLGLGIKEGETGTRNRNPRKTEKVLSDKWAGLCIC